MDELERLINFPLVEQVKDLESKLKEQVKESESHSFILQQKVVELWKNCDGLMWEYEKQKL